MKQYAAFHTTVLFVEVVPSGVPNSQKRPFRVKSRAEATSPNPERPAGEDRSYGLCCCLTGDDVNGVRNKTSTKL